MTDDLTQRESNFLRKTGMAGAYLLGFGWMFGAILLLAGNIILGMNLLDPPRPLTFPWEAGPSLHLYLAWLLIMFSYLVFIFTDFALTLAFAAFGLLYLPNCRIYRLLMVGVIVWMTIAVLLDATVGGAAWVYGLLGDGVNPEKFGALYKWWDHTVLNIVRFPVRGMYFFIGLACYLFAWLGKQNNWPKGLRLAAIVFGTTLMWSVVTFAYNVLFPEHQIHSHTFYTNFFLGGPWFGIRLARAFRGSSAPA